MNICVIENIERTHEQFVLNLQDLYPDPETIVVPAHDQPCSNWRDARKLLSRFSIGQELVLLLDLALEGEDDPTEGVEFARATRIQHKDAIIIAVTSHAHWLQRHKEAHTLFDAVIDKGQHEMKRSENLRNILKGTIDEMRYRRSGNPNPEKPSVIFQDSLGMRIAEVALGSESLHQLIWNVTRNWEHRIVQTLTSGFSGSYLLEVAGKHDGQPAKLVLKVATKRRILESEASAQLTYAAQLHSFAGKINTAVGGVEQLDSQQVYYSVQARVPGATLYELLRQGPKSAARNGLEELIGLLLEQYHYSSNNSASGERTAERRLGLSPVDAHRVSNSCQRLLSASNLITREKAWPEHVKPARQIFSSIAKIAQNWPRYLADISVPYWAIQHGDLHPGNVIISGKQLSFIDLARFGAWPIGYDLSRLATQTRIHIPDQKDDRDWLFNGLQMWTQEEFALLGTSNSSSKVCEWATTCDRAFESFVCSRPESERESLRRLYMFCALSDLMRILSYGTLSHFKRIWAGIACWQLATRLGLPL